jgi:hypothetical protein
MNCDDFQALKMSSNGADTRSERGLAKKVHARGEEVAVLYCFKFVIKKSECHNIYAFVVLPELSLGYGFHR